uniref:FAD-dependent oxidoreductase n=1 Tax=Pseudonocardia pini TaxID=2758030 RepID=UPI0015F03C90
MDVVVVGGGVGGCAIAARLAAAGLAVTVLERETAYRDQVRGEGMVPWGFQEVVALGLADVLLETPGLAVITRMVPYDETVDVATARRAARDLASA